jgi:hypothetical protein
VRDFVVLTHECFYGVDVGEPHDRREFVALGDSPTNEVDRKKARDPADLDRRYDLYAHDLLVPL